MDNKRLILSLFISLLFHFSVGLVVLKLYSPSKDLGGTVSEDTDLSDTEYKTQSPSATQEYVITPADQSRKNQEVNIHRVKRGESLWVIAREYQVSIEQLMDANGLSSRHVLKVGDKLKIPQK